MQILLLDHLGFSGFSPSIKRVEAIWTASQPFLPELFQHEYNHSWPSLSWRSPQPGRQVVDNGQKMLVSWTEATQCKLVRDVTRRLQPQAHLGKHVNRLKI